MTTIPSTIQERVSLPLPTASSPGGGAKTVTSGDILAMMRQRMITIIIASLLFGAIGVGLFFLFYFQFPEYSAEAYIECTSDAPAKPLSIEQPQLMEDQFLRFIQSQAIFIKSYPILDKVLKTPEVRNTQWFSSVPENQRLLELEEELIITPMRDTSYIRVAMSTRHVNDPHFIVNAVVATYLHETKERAAGPYRDQLQEYRREYADIKDEIQLKQAEIREFAASLPPGEVSTDPGRLGHGLLWMKMMQDQEQVALLQQQTSELKGLMDIYANPEGLAVTPQDQLAVEQDPRVAMMDNQVFGLEQELRILLSDFGPKHREYREMESRLAELKRQVDVERANKLHDVIEYKQQQIETAYYNSQHALNLALEQAQVTQAAQADLESKLSEYAIMTNDLQLLIISQTRLDEHIQEIERIVAKSTAVRVQQAVAAFKPLKRSSPSILLLPIIVILALGLAVSLALGLEMLDTSVKTSQDIVRHLNLAVLGSIPDVDDEEVDIAQVETAVIESPHSMVTEAFRTIRSNLQFSAPATRMRSILVTSSQPEDGRTTVAANLAASLAIGGKRVLLVDTNLRRPALHRIHKQAAARGMTNVLVGEAKASECIHHTALANLDVIGSGPIPPNPAELLGSDHCRAFIDEVTKLYDHVIFDSPPALLASDASILASLVDGTILVCRAKDNSRGVVQRACTLLGHVNAHIFGAVLNVAQARRGGYFREQLRTFYEYQTEEDRGASKPPALPDSQKPGAKKSGGKKSDDTEDEDDN